MSGSCGATSTRGWALALLRPSDRARSKVSLPGCPQMPTDVRRWPREQCASRSASPPPCSSRAVRDRRLVSNPCAGVRLPEIHKSRVQPLQTSSVVALRDAMPPRWQAAVVLGAGTGVRQGELLGLTVDRIDFLRRQMVVDRQLINLPGQAPQLAPVKTRASVRTVPLPQTVVAALAEHLAAFPAESTGLVFVGDDGRPMMRSAWSGSVWRPAVKAAGLDFSVTFHALRHYYASLLIRHGESVKRVKPRLGHSSAAQTLDVYSHLWPDSDDRTRDAVDAVLGAVADSVRTAEGAQA